MRILDTVAHRRRQPLKAVPLERSEESLGYRIAPPMADTAPNDGASQGLAKPGSNPIGIVLGRVVQTNSGRIDLFDSFDAAARKTCTFVITEPLDGERLWFPHSSAHQIGLFNMARFDLRPYEYRVPGHRLPILTNVHNKLK